MSLYGIVSVTFVEGKFNRHWVAVPSGDIIYTTPEEAEEMAAKMELATLEDGVVGVSYRPRVYNEREFDV